MGDLTYRTSFVLCSLPFAVVVTDALGIDPRFSRAGLALMAAVWIVLLQRIGRGGTPAGASGREVAILRPGPSRLLGMLIADNASRLVLCGVYGAAVFGREWIFVAALFVATRLVGFRWPVAVAGVALLGLTGVVPSGPARTVVAVLLPVLVVVFAGSAYVDRYGLRAAASGSDGTDARFMVQMGDWHGLVDRFLPARWLPASAAWVVLGVASLGASELLRLPNALVVPIAAFVAAHVVCRTSYAAMVQPDRRRLIVRASGGTRRVVAASSVTPLVLGTAASTAAVVLVGPAIGAGVAAGWLLVMAESIRGGFGMGRFVGAFGATAYGPAAFAVRTVPVVAAVGLADVPPGPWSASVGGLGVAAAGATLVGSMMGVIRGAV